MSPFAVAIVLGSTFMHAGWNLLARSRRPESAFFLKMLIVSVAVGLVPAVISEALTGSLSLKAWVCVVGSGFFCGGYYFFLARAYASSDFTMVYPVARALPVLLVGIGDVLRAQYPTPVGWAGMVLVVSGCFLVPLRSFGEVALRRSLNRTGLWVLLTALATVGYTLLDKAAAEVVTAGPATAVRYGYFFFLFSLVFYAPLHKFFGTRHDRNAQVGWRAAGFGALLNFGAYWLVLWAYQLSRRASYIVAFRQFSIVIGVVAAFAIFREQGRAIRLAGTLLITTGLILIGLLGG